MKKRDKNNWKRYNDDWNHTSRVDGIRDSLPFIALLGGVAALVGLLIFLMKYFS